MIHYGGIYVLCGLVVPWGSTLLVERQGLAALGMHRERWLLSLILGLVMAGLFLPLLLLEGDLGALPPKTTGQALVVLTGAGGLFELFLYCGFIHLRLEKALGTIPAIVVTAVLYVAWHTGTQLPLEPDPLLGAVKLLGVGLMFQAVFSLTRNLLVIWPFFHAVGVMLDFAVNIGEVEPASQAFLWAVGSLALMAASAVLLVWLARQRVPGSRQQLLINR